MNMATQTPGNNDKDISTRGHHRRDDAIRFFKISEVAERLQVAPRTIHRWIQSRKLIVHRVDGVVRIADGDLRAFLASHREA